ncbi:MAG TPA: hypothetical protein VL307_17550 [Chitinophagaceae bacterium]|nr:hypothetical protein [Chitinophagaceae bacterium]
MFSHKKSYLAALIVTCLAQLSLQAQDTTVLSKDSIEVNVQQKGQYAFVIYGGGGISSYVGPIGAPGLGAPSSVQRNHAAGTFRIMWHPDHLLRVGIETGYITFYDYAVQNGATKGRVQLSGIPVLLVWSMALSKRFNVFAGVGSYFMATDLTYKDKVRSSTLALGINASVNYVQPISPKLGIAAELKWSDVTQTKDYAMSAQLMLVWKFLEW